MPLARISVPAALSPEKVCSLADAVHMGLVATCDVPPKDRFQLVSTFADTHMIIDPHFPNVNRTPEACIVEILFLEGRTADQKTALFRYVADRAVESGFVSDDVMITLTENAPIDWSAGRGESFAGTNNDRVV